MWVCRTICGGRCQQGPHFPAYKQSIRRTLTSGPINTTRKACYKASTSFSEMTSHGVVPDLGNAATGERHLVMPISSALAHEQPKRQFPRGIQHGLGFATKSRMSYTVTMHFFRPHTCQITTVNKCYSTSKNGAHLRFPATNYDRYAIFNEANFKVPRSASCCAHRRTRRSRQVRSILRRACCTCWQFR